MEAPGAPALDGSEYQRTIHGRVEGRIPAPDLAAEAQLQEVAAGGEQRGQEAARELGAERLLETPCCGIPLAFGWAEPAVLEQELRASLVRSQRRLRHGPGIGTSGPRADPWARG